MCVSNGMNIPPLRGETGESGFGLAIGGRVRIVDDRHFTGWHGHVRAFSEVLVAVDLDEPPPGRSPNGQWFRPEKVSPA